MAVITKHSESENAVFNVSLKDAIRPVIDKGSQVEMIRDMAYRGADDKELKGFVDRRLDVLEEKSVQQKDVCVLNPIVTGFINPDTRIVRSLWATSIGFSIDDREVYHDLVRNMVTSARKNTEIGDADAVMKAVGRVLFDYFKSSSDVSERNRKNIELYQSNMQGGQPMPMKKLKGNGLAVCAENAAVAHNLFEFLGCKSTLIFGKIEKNGKEDLHAFVAVEIGYEHYIFDQVQPTLTRQQDGSTSMISGMHHISVSEFEALEKGRTVEVYSKIYAIDGSVEANRVYRYTGPQE